MKIARKHIVIGTGYGDEGKGAIVQTLANQMRDAIVMKSSGGSQCGHTVWYQKEGLKELSFFTYTSLGANSNPNATTYIGPEFLLDPFALIAERDEFYDKFGFFPRIIIDPACRIIIPWDKLANHYDRDQHKNGTTCNGIYQAYKRNKDGYSLLAGDILYGSFIYEQKERLAVDYWKKQVNAYQMLASSLEPMLELQKNVRSPELSSASKLICENGQGLLLLPDTGFFPHVTPNYHQFKDTPEAEETTLHFVTRAYATRHGNGPTWPQKPVENFADNVDVNLLQRTEINMLDVNQKGAQGKFKHGVLNLDLIRYGLERNKHKFPKNCTKFIHVTCLDHIKEGSFMFVYEDKLHTFKYADKFIRQIAKILDMDQVSGQAGPRPQDSFYAGTP